MLHSQLHTVTMGRRISITFRFHKQKKYLICKNHNKAIQTDEWESSNIKRIRWQLNTTVWPFIIVNCPYLCQNLPEVLKTRKEEQQMVNGLKTYQVYRWKKWIQNIEYMKWNRKIFLSNLSMLYPVSNLILHLTWLSIWKLEMLFNVANGYFTFITSRRR